MDVQFYSFLLTISVSASELITLNMESDIYVLHIVIGNISINLLIIQDAKPFVARKWQQRRRGRGGVQNAMFLRLGGCLIIQPAATGEEIPCKKVRILNYNRNPWRSGIPLPLDLSSLVPFPEEPLTNHPRIPRFDISKIICRRLFVHMCQKSHWTTLNKCILIPCISISQ